MFKRWRQRRLFKKLAVEEAERGQEALREARKAMEALRLKARREMRHPLAPTCPRCGSALLVRIAKKGRTPGAQFWGCASWPGCSFSADLEEIVDPRLVTFSLD